MASIPARVLRRAAAGSGARAAQADHRAVGSRPRRLPARPPPAGFAEWNDRFRDTVRRFWRGDPGQRPEPRGSRRPTCSTTSGAIRGRRSISSPRTTASRLPISRRIRRNTTKPTARTTATAATTTAARTGASKGRPTTRRSVTRARVARSMLATLFTALGTPMLVAGDEFGRTQHGNNNAYCRTTSCRGSTGIRRAATKR